MFNFKKQNHEKLHVFAEKPINVEPIMEFPNDDIFKMKLHDRLTFKWFNVYRVPGGWIYDGISNSVFVPEKKNQ